MDKDYELYRRITKICKHCPYKSKDCEYLNLNEPKDRGKCRSIDIIERNFSR